MLINLLPHRQWALMRRRQRWLLSLLGAAGLALLTGCALQQWLAQQLGDQAERTRSLKIASSAVDAQLVAIAHLKTELAALGARDRALADFQRERELPVRWLNEMVRHLPDGLYLTSLKQEGRSVLVQGAARSSVEVFGLLGHISGQGRWLTRPELIELGSLAAGPNPATGRSAVFALRAALGPADGERVLPAAPARLTP